MLSFFLVCMCVFVLGGWCEEEVYKERGKGCEEMHKTVYCYGVVGWNIDRFINGWSYFWLDTIC